LDAAEALAGRWLGPVVERVTPAGIPFMARPTFRAELLATALLMVAMATIEGGIIAVFAKQSFSGSVSDRTLNLTVGLLGAAAELANILSFVWSGVSQGKPKVQLLTRLMVVILICIVVIAMVPTRGLWALWTLLGLVLIARLCWSGVLTLRPTIWRANYPRHVRVNVVGVLAGIQVLMVAIVGISLAAVLDKHPDAYRYFLPSAVVVALVGVWVYSRIRVRREGKLLREENDEGGWGVGGGVGGAGKVMRPWQGPGVVLRVLREDRWYAQFMLWMFVLGFANLTVTPTLVISLKEEFHFGHLESVLITSSIPCIATLLAIPLWRRFLDRSHVVHFRAIHAWVFVLASVAYCIGAWQDTVGWYFAGATLMGIGFGGGSLAWNLGHVDFAPPSQTSKYMATHVTLNGVRGLLAPIAVTSAYEALKAKGLDAHLWVQVVALGISVVGAAGFVHLRYAMGKLVEARPRGA
jgi:MFS family permease